MRTTKPAYFDSALQPQAAYQWRHQKSVQEGGIPHA